jgi:hypothetical protein
MIVSCFPIILKTGPRPHEIAPIEQPK